MSLDCTGISAQQMYLIGVATSISAYALINSLLLSSYKVRRNLHLLFSSILTLTCCIVSLYINIGSGFQNSAIISDGNITLSYEDPTGLNVGRQVDFYGLNVILLFLAVLFSSLAALHRYTSHLAETVRVLTLSIFSVATVILYLFCIGLAVFNILNPFVAGTVCLLPYSNGTTICTFASVTTSYIPVAPSFSWLLKYLTVVTPIGHVVFGSIIVIKRVTNPPLVYKTAALRTEGVCSEIMAFGIVVAWSIYLVIELVSQAGNYNIIQGISYISADYIAAGQEVSSGLASTGLIGCIYLVLHSFTLMFEALISPNSTNLSEEEETQEESAKDNFFTTTVATGQDHRIEV